MLSTIKGKKSLEAIKQPIAEEMRLFEGKFRETMSSDVPLLDKITYYISKRKGKQMRPMFVFLAAKLCGDVSDSTYTAASFIEMIHTATLVHDDVVDDSNERRGFFSINALWKNKIAVLVGDFILSRGMLIAIKKKEFQLLEIMSEAIESMSKGELLQIEKARRLDIEESIYYTIIKGKTASLFASACAAGVASTTKDETLIQQAKLLGEKLGMAFQIKDDLFDYGTDAVGKPVGNDIKEKKMTLPLIFALNNASRSTRNKIINIVKRINNQPEKVAEVIAFVKGSGGLEYTQEVMYKYRKEAFDILATFPASPARTSLKELISYVTERKK